ncbi:hypothetical protein BU23DRAFT_274205 [Bimuria novae-zelandiae CBS 107.79]|uniref:Rhodopsin domain-containing protein n=1 Tax=Bimuria novae-zelandiae CBS 107.79 TaxID=1447943 RepID=A0A6A5VXD2_9PLEO|nr:hypothetical protein BU23DRAFT_274205 [Bimuria novae-zelandiae CBS 107.79]
MMAPHAEALPRTTGSDGREHPHMLSLTTLQGLAWTFAALGIILTIVRLLHRWKNSRCLHLDDIFSAVATTILVPFTAMTLQDDAIDIEMTMYRLGRSDHIPSLEKVDTAIKTEVACTVLFWIIIYAAKASFLAAYWRTFCANRVACFVWYTLAAVTAISFGALFMSVFWICGQPSNVGDLVACKSVGTAYAIRLLTVWCVLNLVDCFLLIVYPFANTSFSRTQLNTRQTICISLMLLLVAFFVALDILRTYWNLTLSLSETTNLVLLWRLLEPSVAVILCAMSGFAGLCRVPRSDSDISDDERGWIEIGRVGKDTSG